MTHENSFCTRKKNAKATRNWTSKIQCDIFYFTAHYKRCTGLCFFFSLYFLCSFSWARIRLNIKNNWTSFTVENKHKTLTNETKNEMEKKVNEKKARTNICFMLLIKKKAKPKKRRAEILFVMRNIVSHWQWKSVWKWLNVKAKRKQSMNWMVTTTNFLSFSLWHMHDVNERNELWWNFIYYSQRMIYMFRPWTLMSQRF